MKITDSVADEAHHVRIAMDGRRTFEIDGIDYSRVVAAYTLHQQAGGPAELVVQCASGRTVPAFNGYARVAVGVPYEPGEAAARFLSAIDAGLLEKAALVRADLDGGQHGFTRAVLAQLQEWAQGKITEEETR
ncbi:hypothetical protein ABZ626_03700 [Streptomyces longispororuber]|uniref:hypothetical protein n=1 Tax=Streptomyces longispororuber TaxID=68230 RepID=UPI00340F1BF6